MAAPAFFAHLDGLVAAAEVTIDRSRGTEHPRVPGAIYPVDYGFLVGTTGGDGAGTDVFCGSGGSGVVGVALTADPVKRDVEVKILLDCTDGEVRAVGTFLSDALRVGELVVRREPESRDASGGWPRA